MGYDHNKQVGGFGDLAPWHGIASLSEGRFRLKGRVVGGFFVFFILGYQVLVLEGFRMLALGVMLGGV